jgi:predicted transcriptional regulator
MPQNKIKDLFDNSPGNTVDLKKECSELTGINIRTIQMYYSDKFKMPSMNNVIKLRAFFSQKLGREIDIDEIIVARNYVVNRSVNTIIKKIESH